MEIKDIRKLTLTQRHDLIYQLNSAKREVDGAITAAKKQMKLIQENLEVMQTRRDDIEHSLGWLTEGR